jgi:hypothetical protein
MGDALGKSWNEHVMIKADNERRHFMEQWMHMLHEMV